MTTSENPALKDIFDASRFRHIAQETAALHSGFDPKLFLKISLKDLDTLTLMQRMRRMTESLHATLPSNYRKALTVLRQLAPRINHNFVTLVLSDYVGLYGHDDFDTSMDALKFFTVFGSSEFAIREFLRRDLLRTLAVMETWSRDDNEAVRRLASEGCRPRLPWSFRLDALIADPSQALQILENLRADPSLYVRKSVANHLNDITKDHPDWMLDRVENWPLEKPHTAWIVRHALRSLIKKGERRALALIGAGEKAKVRVHDFIVSPQDINLGDSIALSFQLQSQSTKAQRLVVDYVLHYIKKSGLTSAKVFKLKELTLAANETVLITRKQSIRDFTTRVHYSGKHEVDIVINGDVITRNFFNLA